MRIRVKVCGIASLEDALLAVEAGADAVGFIFVPGTPRHVTPDQAAAIVAALPPLVAPVGVFWDHPVAEVRAVAAAARLAAVQLHGAEPPEDVAALGLPVLKTIKVEGPADLLVLDRYRPAAFLLDSKTRWSEGEARAPISWTLAGEAARRARVVLAAGLTPENVGRAIGIARPLRGGRQLGSRGPAGPEGSRPGAAVPGRGPRGLGRLGAAGDGDQGFVPAGTPAGGARG